MEFFLDDGDGGEGASVFGAGAEVVEGLEVGFSAVGFVFGEVVAGVAGFEVEAEVVTGDFGHDGGAGDEEAACVAFDDGGVGGWEAFYGEAIDEGVVGQARECFEGTAHGEVGGIEDIELVNLLDRGDANAYGHLGVVCEDSPKRLSTLLGELLGVVGSF